MDRSNFYFEQEVTQAELDQAFDDVEAVATQQITDHNDSDDDFALWGVLTGLHVQQQTAPNLTVKITDGVAYDENGERIVHSGGPTTVNLATHVPGVNSRYVAVYVEHATVESDPRVDGAAVPLNYRIADSFAFSLVDGAIAASPVRPALVADKVLLAHVLLTAGQTQILTANISMNLGIDYSGGGSATPRDRQEGGVCIAHGRMNRRAISFVNMGPNEPDVIRLGANHLNTEQGDIKLAYFPDVNSGGRVFMQGGRIFRAHYVQAYGPPDAGHGFVYVHPTTGDEQGDFIAVNKQIAYTADDFWPEASAIQAPPWQMGAPVDDNWYRDDTWGGGPPPTWFRTAYRYKLVNGGTLGSPLWGLPLHCSLKLPLGVRLVGFDLWVEVLAGGMPSTVWVDTFLQQRGRSTMTPIHDALAPFTNATPGTYTVSVEATYTTYVDTHNAYEAIVCIKSESSDLPNVRIWGGRARLEIHEASWQY